MNNKWLWIVLCFCMSGCLKLTLLDGNYSWHNEQRGVTYYFHPDHTFSSYGWSDNARDTGVGIYQIVNDSIYLTYGKLSFAAESLVVADTVPSEQDICSLKIWTADNHGAIPCALKFQMPESNMSTVSMSGYYQMQLNRSAFPVTIQCTWGNYDAAEIRIQNPADSEIDYYMKLTDAAAISEGTRVGMEFKRRGRKLYFTYTRALNGGGWEKATQKLKLVQ